MDNEAQAPQDALNDILRSTLAQVVGCSYVDIEYRGGSSDGFFLHGAPLVSKGDLVHGLPDGPIIVRANEILAREAIQKLITEGASRAEAVRIVYYPYMSDDDYANLCRGYDKAFGKR